jgi:hypothetical protein
MASKGHRVIACAQYLLPGPEYAEDHEFPITNYALLVSSRWKILPNTVFMRLSALSVLRESKS